MFTSFLIPSTAFAQILICFLLAVVTLRWFNTGEMFCPLGARSGGELQLQDEGDLPRSDGPQNYRSPKRSNSRRRQVRINTLVHF